MMRFIGKFAAVAIVAAIGLPGIAGASRGNDDHDGGRCTGKPFVLVKVSDLDAAEKARAEKMDRNGNGSVCRKDIPGQGGGNTGNASTIKDDKI